MPIQCEELEYCKIKVEYVAEPETVEDKYEEALKVFKSGKINVPGFRPGKATDTAIKVHCKTQLDEFVKREMLTTAYDDVVFETKMKPIGYPQVLNTQLTNNSFYCEMIFMKRPEFEPKDYVGFDIPKPHEEMTPSDLAEKMVQDMRMRFGQVMPYGENDFVDKGDQITVDIECKINDEVFEMFTKQGFLYRVGDDLIPELDDKLLGMQAGEERDVDIIYMDDVPEEIRGKRAKFHINVHMGTKTTPHPLDDSLAQKYGIKTYNEFRNRVQSEASARLNAISVQKTNQQVVTRLLNNNEFEVPPWLVSMEAQRLAAQQGIKWDTLSEENKELVVGRAKDSVKLSILLDTIRDVEPESSFSDEELINNIKMQVKESGQNPDQYIKQAEKDGSLIGMIASLREEATLQWIISKCNIIE
jgi:trigger factor